MPGNLYPTRSEPGPQRAQPSLDAIPGHFLFRIPIDRSVTIEEYFRHYDFDVYMDGEPSGWIDSPI